MRAAPALVAHCDWSLHAAKRWLSLAVREGQGWRFEVPEPVGDTATLARRLAARRRMEGSVLVGFDFPIGLPHRYGALTGFSGFREALPQLGQGPWAQWYAVAETPAEISLQRPFYPYRPGGTRRAHLFDGLGIAHHDLQRTCERSTLHRPAASMLFWTLGGNQVGKAAITGWREVVLPALAHGAALWPFDGALPDLAATRDLVLAETYPGEVYHQLGIPRGLRWSKRKQAGRKAVAPYLHAELDRHAHAGADLRALVTDGFGPPDAGEDPFDALVGLLGMLRVTDGLQPEGVPDDPAVRNWEGWILGQVP